MTPAPRRPGRPRKRPEELQRAMLQFLVTEAEYDAVARMAIREGESISRFLRVRVLPLLGISPREKGPIS